MKPKSMSSEGFYGWINLGIMFLFNFVSGSLLLTFGIFLPFWVDDFGWSRGLVSGAQAANMLLTGLVAPAVGLFIMRFGGKKAIIIGNLLNAGGLLLLSFFTEVWQLYLGYGVMIGMGFSLGGMLAMNTIINNWFRKKLSIAVGIATAATGVTGMVLAPLVLHLINSAGWRNTFLFMAVIVMFFCVIIPGIFLKNRPYDLGQVPDGPRSTKPATSKKRKAKNEIYRTSVDFTVKEALKTKVLWLLVAFHTLQFLTMNWIVTHQVTYMFDIGISSGMTGLAIGIMSTAMTLAQISAGLLAVRINMQHITLSAVVILISGVIIASFAKSFYMVILYSAFFGIGFGVNALVLVNMLPNYFGISEYPKIMGYISPFNYLIGSIAAPIAGHVRDITGSYVPAFQVSVIIMAIAFVCIFFARPPKHPSLLRRSTRPNGRIKTIRLDHLPG